jgi:hypothetical protein
MIILNKVDSFDIGDTVYFIKVNDPGENVDIKKGKIVEFWVHCYNDLCVDYKVEYDEYIESSGDYGVIKHVEKRIATFYGSYHQLFNTLEEALDNVENCLTKDYELRTSDNSTNDNFDKSEDEG